jgi:hypothetical protein
MIILDYSEISMGSALNELRKELENQDQSVYPMIRHLVFNHIKFMNTNFGSEYGEILISCDSRKYWRKDKFPYYKGRRKIDRAKSKIDWNLLYSFINQIKSDLIEYTPYKVIEVDGAESDDVISVITKYLSTNDKFLVQDGFIANPPKILIGSSDNDFIQLGKYKNVFQRSKIVKKLVPTPADIEAHLFEKSIRGEVSDGIPNCLSADNCLVDKIKQKSITTKWITPILESKTIPENVKDKYMRNRELIDFEYIPREIESKIIETFDSTIPKGNASTLFKYFGDNGMMKHLDDVQNFLQRKVR